MENFIYGEVIGYLKAQRERCLQETGCLPSLVDYAEHLESEEFRNLFGDKCLDKIFDWLLIHI